MPRPYRVPWSPVLPGLGILFALYLMKDLPLSTWLRFIGWLAVGMLIYWLYGYRNSKLRRDYATAHAGAGPNTTAGEDPTGTSDSSGTSGPGRDGPRS
jgi:APA family basic amino acid/polyamine antiporter